MPAQVKLTPAGFIVLDDFGLEGFRPVLAGRSPNGPGVVVFAACHRATEYARARDAHADHWNEHGPTLEGLTPEQEIARHELLEECKRIPREHGRIVDTFEATPA